MEGLLPDGELVLAGAVPQTDVDSLAIIEVISNLDIVIAASRVSHRLTESFAPGMPFTANC